MTRGKTPSSAVFRLLEREKFITSILDLPDDNAKKHIDPSESDFIWYGICGVFLPDRSNIPDTLVGILDIPHQLAQQSRYYTDGASLQDAAVRVIVRSTDPEAGWLKITQISAYLDSIENESVALTFMDNHQLAGELVTVLTCSRSDSVQFLGADITNRRFLYEARYAIRFT